MGNSLELKVIPVILGSCISYHFLNDLSIQSCFKIYSHFLAIMNIDHEVNLLKEEITRLGTKDEATGNIVVEFGVLFADDRCANIFEALIGTLRAAKKRKIIDFEGQMLFQGVHDKVPIKLLASA